MLVSIGNLISGVKHAVIFDQVKLKCGIHSEEALYARNEFSAKHACILARFNLRGSFLCL